MFSEKKILVEMRMLRWKSGRENKMKSEQVKCQLWIRRERTDWDSLDILKFIMREKSKTVKTIMEIDVETRWTRITIIIFRYF